MLKNIKAGIIAIMLSLLLIPLTPNPSYAYATDIEVYPKQEVVGTPYDSETGIDYEVAKEICEEERTLCDAFTVYYGTPNKGYFYSLEDNPDGLELKSFRGADSGYRNYPGEVAVSCLVEPDYLDLSESKMNPSLGYIQEWLSVVDGTAKSIDLALNNTGYNEETITLVAGNCVKNIQAPGGYTIEVEDICDGYPPFKNMQVRALYPSNIHLLVTECEPE
ncbi:hypothetical protein [Okeania sp. SIO2B3]|uniref:hypothetical protein n=1 Tax=Okeania sp. SIO2B3 TaxID=2607784 RepID=UPI0013C1CA05|nr:hypothetical protein [Okeania sp. SIO2B3]NET45772.1 hypothetical protein [Okeania sp. SIO2B3]